MLPEKKIEKYLRNAKIVSLLSDNKKTRVGCVVVYKNKIISMGHNYENKTSPLQKKYNELRGYDPNDSIRIPIFSFFLIAFCNLNTALSISIY